MLRDEDAATFKQWLLPRLETISDADAEVLADYVIALVTANESEESLRKNCLESLADFLQDNTTSFVDDIVKALKTKSYAAYAPVSKTKPSFSTLDRSQPRQPAPIPSIVGPRSPPLDAPRGPAATRAPKSQSGLSATSGGASHDPSSRKRKLAQRDTSEAREVQNGDRTRAGSGYRPIMKQSAGKGGRNLRGGAVPFEPHVPLPPPGFNAPLNLLNMANLPPPPPGPMPFDNPMALFAMMAALGTNLPGMPPLPPIPSSNTNGNVQVHKEKCHDYHNKGYCALGLMCPYEHGDTIRATADVRTNKRHRGGAVINSGSRGGRRRASFSQAGPSSDNTNNTLVVEQIPEENCNEDSVRDFFSKFGVIAEVQMQMFRRLAVIKFEDHAAAVEAYHSPKAVFDNRFVKVYWYRPESKGYRGDVEMADNEHEPREEEERLDPEEIAKRQAEAQEAFEERRRKIEEADARAAEIERQIQEKDLEMRDIRRELAKLAGGENSELEEAYSQDLATLQAEAESLFAQNGVSASSDLGHGHFARGAYRGRGSMPASYRGRGGGAYRGRGGYSTPYAGGKSSVKRLDNRPRRLAVAGIEKGSQKDEALRQYLVNMPECSSIEQHPEQADTVVLTFEERFHAEMFLDQSRKIPDAGPLELSWVPNDALGGLKSTTTTNINDLNDADASDGASSATVAETARVDEAEDNRHEADTDMDVADDVDQWL